MLKLNIGANRKVQGDEQSSSKGFSCNLEVELPDALVNDPQALRGKIREIFEEAKEVVTQVSRAMIQAQRLNEGARTPELPAIERRKLTPPA